MRCTALLATLALLATAIPAHAESTQDRNVAFLWSILGDEDPATLATMPDGRVVSLGIAVDEAASRAGLADLASLANGALIGGQSYVGDIWLLSYGAGPCGALVVAPQPVSAPLHGQAWVYAGEAGRMSANAFVLYVFDWTTKESSVHFNVQWDAMGVIDFYCVTFGGMHFAFPTVDGVVNVGGV